MARLSWRGLFAVTASSQRDCLPKYIDNGKSDYSVVLIRAKLYSLCPTPRIQPCHGYCAVISSCGRQDPRSLQRESPTLSRLDTSPSCLLNMTQAGPLLDRLSEVHSPCYEAVRDSNELVETTFIVSTASGTLPGGPNFAQAVLECSSSILLEDDSTSSRHTSSEHGANPMQHQHPTRRCRGLTVSCHLYKFPYITVKCIRTIRIINLVGIAYPPQALSSATM